MKRLLCVCVLAVSVAATAQEKEGYRINGTAMAASKPALKHRLLVDVVDQTPGNAALIYLTAAQQYAEAKASRAKEPGGDNDEELIDKWLGLPVDQLPKAQAEALLQKYSGALNQMRLATLRDRCDFDPPFRLEGYRTLLPYLNDSRKLARLVALQARVYTASGQFNASVYMIRQLFVQSRHLGEQLFLVQSLVAAAIANMGVNEIRVMVSQPGAPNMYWTLGDCPAPFIDMRKAMQFERAGLYFSVPGLKEARSGQLSADQWRAINMRLAVIGRDMGLPERQDLGSQIGAAFTAAKDFPAARQYMIDQGKTPAEVDALSSAQVLGAYYVEQYEAGLQDVEKWLSLPFAQGIQGLTKSNDELAQSAKGGGNTLAAIFLPALRSPYVTLTLLDRQIAMLRVAEALRGYAAAHQGTLPASLDDLTDMPPITDPMTGKAFEYQMKDNVAVLQAVEMSAGTARKTSLRYEISIRK